MELQMILLPELGEYINIAAKSTPPDKNHSFAMLLNYDGL